MSDTHNNFPPLDAEHSIMFSPSAGLRWIFCAPSSFLESLLPNVSNIHADTGKVAHQLGEWCLKGKNRTTQGFKRKTIEVNGTRIPVDDEMRRHVQGYVNYVRSLAGEHIAEGRLVYIPNPRMYGTADAIVLCITGNVIHVVDLKYGKSVKVSVEDNKQLLIYALMAVHKYGYLFMDRDKRLTITLHIYQPRMDNIVKHTITYSSLNTFERALLKRMEAVTDIWKKHGHKKNVLEAAKALTKQMNAGDHCKYCRLNKAKPICPKLISKSKQLAKIAFSTAIPSDGSIPMQNKAAVKKMVDDLTPQQINRMLMNLNLVQEFGNNFKKYAYDRAMKGEKITGYKIIKSMSNRYFKNETKVLEICKRFRIKAQETVKKMKSVAQLEQEYGKDKIEDKLGKLIKRDITGYSLVPEKATGKAVPIEELPKVTD